MVKEKNKELAKEIIIMIFWVVLLGGAIVYSSKWLVDFSFGKVLVWGILAFSTMGCLYSILKPKTYR